MENKGLEDQAVNIVQALAQVKKKQTAIAQLRHIKDEFQGRSDIQCDITKELSDLRVRVWKKNPEASIRSLNQQHITFEGISLERVPSPPPGYAYKGGAARLALLELLGEPVGVRAPRDLDLVRIGTSETKTDHFVAKEFMEEDLKRGYGVEIIKSIDKYMKSRDLTLNEILYFQDRIVCSLTGLKDTLAAKIRFTSWSKKDGGKPQSRVFVKALRFHAESRIEGREYDLSQLEEPGNITPFDIALHLDRALTRGTKVAEAFCQNCCQHGLLPQKLLGASVGDVGAYLLKKDPKLKRSFPALSPVKSKTKKPLF